MNARSAPWNSDQLGWGNTAANNSYRARSGPALATQQQIIFDQMSQMDWYRQTEWTREIEDEFERRLTRSRGQRSEYLRIQAITLVEQNVPRLALIAISLAKRQLELSPVGISAAQMWATIAKAHITLGQPDDVVDAYRQSIRLEAGRSNVRGNHYIDFAWYVATNSAVELYPEVLTSVDENMQERDLVFPGTQYRFFGALALIAADSGNASEARRMAKSAISAAKSERGPFWRQPLLGLLKGSRDPIRTRLEQLAH
jgi:hypothetical protein